MKIFDTAGNELQRDDIDFSQGRLLQGEEPETLVFTTWQEEPDENQGEYTPSIEDRVSAMEAAIEELMLM